MGKCKKCKCDLSKGSHGELRANFFGIKKWTYWCLDCYRERFIKSIESNPHLLSKYYQIHDRHPKDLL